jgi:nucleoside phosphorylase
MMGRVGDLFVIARPVGIGLVHAAIGAAEEIAQTQPRFVVLLGTCGAYAARSIFIDDVVIADRVMLVEPSALMGASEFPEVISTMLRTDGAICEGLTISGARGVGVATTLAVTVDDGTAAQIARATGAHVEHLEAHAVATACALRGLAFSAVLGVANIVGAQAREQWRANHRSASDAAARHLLRWLELGARGAPR